MRRLNRWLWTGLRLTPLAFLALFFFYPLWSIFQLSLAPQGVLDLSGWVALTRNSYYANIVWFTTWQALLSTALTLLIALPIANIFIRYRFWGRGVLLTLSALPFVLPTVIVAVAFSALLGRNGLLNDALMRLFTLDTAPIELERTLTLILLAHIFYNVPLALRLLVSYGANQSPRLEEAAQTFGISGWRLWWQVRLPLLRPAITSAALLVFLFTFTSFGVILILGGARFATLEVEIHRQTTALFNLPLAALLALLQMAITVLITSLYSQSQRAVNTATLVKVTLKPIPPPARISARIAVVALCALVFLPLFALILRSVLDDGIFSLRAYQQLGTISRQSVLFVAPVVAIGNSLRVALVTMLWAVILGVLAAYLLWTAKAWRGLLDPLFLLPLSTSAVTLGFGFIVALDTPPLNLRSSWWLLPIAHTLVGLPFVVRSVLPALAGIPANVREAGLLFEPNAARRWRLIELPLLARGISVGAAFAFTVSMGEFGATLFVARPETPTIPLMIYRLISRPGIDNYAQALAMSVILLGICALAFLVIEGVRGSVSSEF